MSKPDGKGKKKRTQRLRLGGEASEEAALRLEELARGLRSGAIRLADGDLSIEAPTGHELEWEIDARLGRRKSRIEIDIRWRASESSEGAGEDKETEDTEASEPADEAAAKLKAPETPPAGPSSDEATRAADGPPAQELESPSW